MTATLLNSPRSESTVKGKIWFILYFHIFTKQQKKPTEDRSYMKFSEANRLL